MDNKKYFLLKAKKVSVAFIPVAVISLLLVSWLGEDSIVRRLEIALGISALILFVFLLIGLYRGVQLIKEPFERRDASKEDVFSFMFESADLTMLAGAGSASWATVTALLVLLSITLFNGFVLVISALVWIFYRALRAIFIKSRISKGNLTLSVQYASLFTFLYTGWLFALIWVAEQFLGVIK